MAHIPKIVTEKLPRKTRDKKVKQRNEPPDVGAGNEVSWKIGPLDVRKLTNFE